MKSTLKIKNQRKLTYFFILENSQLSNFINIYYITLLIVNL